MLKTLVPLTLALLLLLTIPPATAGTRQRAAQKDWNALLFGEEPVLDPSVSKADVEAYATCAAFYDLMGESLVWWPGLSSISNMRDRYHATKRTLTTLLGSSNLAARRIKDAHAHLVFLTDGSKDSLKALHARYEADCLARLKPLTASTRRQGTWDRVPRTD